ncbi:hypothetical protein TCAL_08653 [Tigriopus californicus]|uniref:Late endosomal/lysosomal adaptor and MAPK and MTOR activator 5 n=1 Tax=Tigriopus californicus TaxID=6832 RepID=A0A553PDJ9_TIGCA|nr:hypothetical protein TCAL_08653 [Tigriopus californicus]
MIGLELTSFFCSKELDSELLEDKSTILGVVCADDEGNCLEVNGRISPLTANLAASLAQIAAELEPGNLEQPVIVLDKTDKTQLIIKKEESATIAISKQQSSKKL